MEKEKFSIKRRFTCFKYAFNGIRLLIQYEHNACIHFIAAVCVIVASYLLQISAFEWIAVTIVIGMVFSAEAFNTAIEKLSDVVSPDYHEMIKQVKDIAAGGVLITALLAVVTGLIIFIPKLLILLELR